MTTPNKTAVSSGELMIGNWISYRGEKNCWVASIGYEFATEYPDTGNRNGSDDVNEYVGIPLTPEILEKCGFERGSNDAEEKRWLELSMEGVYFAWDQDSKCVNLYESSGEGNTYGRSIYQLHQLQNLYFCLTGEHLKMEL